MAIHTSKMLKKIQKENNFHNMKDFYEKYFGGEDGLQISLRYFHKMVNGEQIPPNKTMFKMFEKIPSNLKKEFVLAIFKDQFKPEEEQEPSFITFLEKFLHPEINKNESTSWNDKSVETTKLSPCQMSYLTENPDALRLFYHLMFNSHVREKEAPYPHVHQKMRSLGLIIKNNEYISVPTMVRTPSYGKRDSSIEVRSAHDFIIKHLDVFSSKEGCNKQVLGFSVNMVSPDVATRVLLDVDNLRKRINIYARTEHDPKTGVPLVFLGFAKELLHVDILND